MNGSAGLDTNALMSLLMAAMLVLLGGRCIYCVIRLCKTYELFPSKILYPANARPEDCRDDLGFIRFISPRMSVFGGLCILLGGFRVLLFATELGARLPRWFGSLGMILLILPVAAWYIFVINTAYKRFWEGRPGRGAGAEGKETER